MAEQGFSVGTFTGGGTFLVENEASGGTLTPVGVTAWGGAGTVTRVGSSMAEALPIGIYGGTFNAGTVTVSTIAAGTIGVGSGTVGLSGGTVSTVAAGTLNMLQAGSVQVTAGTMSGTVSIAGTVPTTFAGGTVAVSGGTVGISGGTISTIAAGTVTVDSELTTADLDTGAGTDTRAVVGIAGAASGGAQLVPGSSTDGLLVNLGANNDVTVTSGTVTATAAGTQTVAGTVSIDGGVTVGTVSISGGTLDSLGGTVAVNVVAGAAGGVSHTDDAAFTPGTDDVVPAAAMFDDVTPDSVDEGDAGVLRMSANRNLYTTLRDAAGNERGVNVTAANALKVDPSGVTQPISGTVGVSSGTVVTGNAGTVAMLQAGTVQVSAGTMVGTVAISTIAAGTVVATAAGTQLVAGTVNVAGTVPVSTTNTGTVTGTVTATAAGTQLVSGTVTATASGTQLVSGTVTATASGTQLISGTAAISGGTVNPGIGQGKTLNWGTINLTSGSVSLVNPGSGTSAYIVGITLTVGTAGVIQFLQGAGAAALSGPIHVDQYGGFVDRGQPSAPVLKGASGSQIYLSITSGIGTAGGYYSYFTEA